MTHPSHDDPVVAALSESVGGPTGAHHRPHPFWTALRVVLAVATVTLALGLVQKAPCVATGWSDSQLRYAAGCYSDIPYLYTGRGMAEQNWPYAETGGRYQTMEYPVLISYFAFGTALLTKVVGAGPTAGERAAVSAEQLWGLPGMAEEVNQYFLVNVIGLAALGLLAAWLLAGTHRERPWDAIAFAASPMLLLNAYLNWDLIAVAFTAGALWAWSRGRPTLTGVLIGLGTAAKLYPLFLLGAVAVVALRRRRPGDLARAVAGAALAWLLVNAPALLTGMSQWQVFWKFNSDRGPDLGSIWLFFANFGHAASADTVNLVSLAFFAAACLAIAVLGLLAPNPPRVAQLGFLIVAAFLLINKVYSPQYVLWLLPLAVLARPRWRDLLIWQAGEFVYFWAVWFYLGQFTASATTDAPDPLYQVAILLRMATEIYLMVVVARDVLHPWRDPVKAPAAQRTSTRSNVVAVNLT